MAKDSTSNGFSSGLVMDYHPLGTPNTALSNALNATMITYNGNELSLLNDMGNGRVETAYLPEGYIPLGTTSFGGIIYIVAYNPLKDVCLIGSFPSPERNFIQGESLAGSITIDSDNFYEDLENNIFKTYQLVIPLTNDDGEEIILSPGDKFALNINTLYKYYGYLQGLLEDRLASSLDPNIKIVLGIRHDGLLRELSNLLEFETPASETGHNYTYITLKNDLSNNSGEKFNVDLYRKSVADSNYNVMNCNISGTLCIIVKLITLDTFNIKTKISTYDS